MKGQRVVPSVHPSKAKPYLTFLTPLNLSLDLRNLFPALIVLLILIRSVVVCLNDGDVLSFL